jgi:hypothetical protein
LTIHYENYHAQRVRWPASGQHILAQYDDDSIVVYQAYRPSIGHYAAKHQRFGADFSFSRMTWLKTNFLWMMYRSGWGTKADQEVTLAIRLQRSGFDEILRAAVPSSWDQVHYSTEADWRLALGQSTVRLQWDPDHDPSGKPLTRRAIQLGIRGATLDQYCTKWIIAIDDITGFVAEQRSRKEHDLIVPTEHVYVPAGGPPTATK